MCSDHRGLMSGVGKVADLSEHMAAEFCLLLAELHSFFFTFCCNSLIFKRLIIPLCFYILSIGNYCDPVFGPQTHEESRMISLPVEDDGAYSRRRFRDFIRDRNSLAFYKLSNEIVLNGI